MPISLPLAAIRAQINNTLAGTAVLYTPAWASDGAGGGTVTYTACGTSPCTVAPLAEPQERVLGDRPQAVSAWRVVLPHGTVLPATYRLMHGTVTYEVVESNETQTDRVSTILRCVVAR